LQLQQKILEVQSEFKDAAIYIGKKVKSTIPKENNNKTVYPTGVMLNDVINKP